MISSPYKAAVVQMTSQTDLDANLEQAYDLLKEAAAEDVLLAGLPENFSFLGGLKMRLNQVEEIAERVPDFLSATADELGIYLLGGSYPVPASNGKVFNHTVMYGPDGNELCSYNKIHLFDVTLSDGEAYRESDYVEPGKTDPVVYKDDRIGSWGLSVCYDIRFPELFRMLVKEGAEILSVPSAFTYTTGQDHWESLLRSRAIENTSYVFAPAQTGLHGENRKTWGHAVIIDPWGNIIANAGTEPCVAYADIEPQKLKETRKKIPSLEHRRI